MVDIFDKLTLRTISAKFGDSWYQLSVASLVEG